MTMIRGELPPPVRYPGQPGDERCARAREQLTALLGSGRTLSEEPLLREHLSLCEDCNALYRTSLVADARLRRAMVDCEQGGGYGSDHEERPRRAVLSPIAIARAGFASSGRGKASWVIALGVLFYAVVRLTPDPTGAARARLESLAGEVIATGEALAFGAPARDLQRGDWVRTPPDVRAQLTFGKTQVVIAPGTELQIEEPSTHRVRLEAGSLDVHGPLLVTSLYGIVQVEGGHATLSIDRGILFVESAEGKLRAIDSQGEHELKTGESTRLAFAR